ncbi:hypothetical protein Pmani_020898 [Petrolisthes manimaculis]|uniref:Uncharacterized protein n=1 Tax=Petrolisthes manimaculis TaxID=1843537 RepID=A0AAE1PHG8_9EUCA|nr:hypothetical protein Pmani_020898 [Petrolisthes manimaculis]
MVQCLTNGEEVLEDIQDNVPLLEVITTPPAPQGSPYPSPPNLFPMQTPPNTGIGRGQGQRYIPATYSLPTPPAWGSATHTPRPPVPPTGPGAATTGMSPATFEAWATSVEDYGFICNWAPPLSASYVRLLCSGEVQQRIDSRIDKLDFRKLEKQAAINIVRSVVIGPRCKVGAWSGLFTYSQEPGDSVGTYISKCRAMAGECNFCCPKCNESLLEYVLIRKAVMGLSNRGMKVEML